MMNQSERQADKVREALSENARHSFQGLLNQLNESDASTQYISPGHVLMTSALACGQTSKAAHQCRSSYASQFGSFDIQSSPEKPSEMMAKCLSVMNHQMRSRSMAMMPEQLKQASRKSYRLIQNAPAVTGKQSLSM